MTSVLKKKLLPVLTRMKDSRCDGVPGVIKLTSWIRGPTLGITACTHGNEPAGLSTIGRLLDEFDLPKKLLRGTVYLVVNNLEAAERYLTNGPIGKNPNYRFVDINMNRLPENVPHDRKTTSYEIVRARQLLPIWRQFTVGFDIHSTSQDSPPMFVGGHIPLKHVHDFPIETIVSDIDIVQIGLPAFGFYGKRRSMPMFEIEAGQHEKPQSLQRAYECTLRLLRNLKMVPQGSLPNEASMESLPPGSIRREYRVVDSIVLPDKTYRLVRKFGDGEFVRKGSTFARGAGRDLRAKARCHTFFCSSKFEEFNDTEEEALFLTKPAVVRRVT